MLSALLIAGIVMVGSPGSVPEPTRCDQAVKPQPNKTVLFDADQSYMLPKEFERLNDIILIALHEPSIKYIVLDGFASSDGDQEYNEELSVLRAAAVAQYLETSGIEPAKVFINGHGILFPAADNSTHQGRVKNRRVEISFIQTICY